MFEHFKNMGLSKGTIDIISGVITKDGNFVHLHIDEPNHKAVEFANGTIVTTLRNPIDVFRSYGKRHQWSVAKIEAAVIHAFDCWSNFVLNIDPFIITVDDNESIELDITNLANSLGVKDFKYEEVNPLMRKAETINRSDFPFDKEPPMEILRLAKSSGY